MNANTAGTIYSVTEKRMPTQYPKSIVPEVMTELKAYELFLCVSLFTN